MKIEGINTVLRAIDRLPEELRKGAEKKVLQSAGAVIRKAAKSNAPVRSKVEAAQGWQPGLLKKSIGLNVKKVRGTYTARIGPRTGFRRVVGIRESGENAGNPYFQDPTKYSHLVEYGTSRAPARPFISPAVERTKSAVVNEMANGLDKYLTRAVARLRRRAGK